MDNNIIVSKFGSTAMADAERIKKTAEIIKSNPNRRYVVVSAPGQLTPDDIKITDLLYICYSRYESRENFAEVLTIIQDRFEEIVRDLGIDFDVATEIAELKRTLFFGKSRDTTASRGEYIVAKILAAYLGWNFVDAGKLIFFNKDGTLNEQTTFKAIENIISNLPNAVIPGGYGMVDGKIAKTTARGDGTGAAIARVLNAPFYEKWTNHPGIFIADQAYVENPLMIRNATYKELLELGYMGISVIYEDAIFKLMNTSVSLNIRNINKPDDKGTIISSQLPEGTERKVAACISGRRNFKMLRIDKFGLNRTHGIGQKIFETFAKYRISCEHYVSGIYNFAVVVKNPMFDLKRQDIIKDITNAIHPEQIVIEKDLSLIAIIGEGMGTVKGIFARIFDAIASIGVKVRMIDQGADDLNIIIGVYDEDFEACIKVLYKAMILD
ncbi:MAG: aspartate kinase [Synergistaceae bacterium]|nr:aspartate kinase [Synergistaceae bacterium]